MAADNISKAFEDEVFYTLRKQRDAWARIAMISLGVTIVAVIALFFTLPLKEVRPFVVMVERTTGEAEKVVEVLPASLAENDAVLQGLLVSYITDRETFDNADNEIRVPEVLRRSSEQAAGSLKALWSVGNAQYPPDVYSESTRIDVQVKSIAVIPGSPGAELEIAQVRILKTRRENSRPVATRAFEVTIGYKFVPQPKASLNDVWKNPLGFKVVSYRLDAESLIDEADS